MKNIDRLVDTMLTSENPEELSWGEQIVAASRFDFGKYDDLKKTVSAETLCFTLKERRDIFRLTHPNCLFYCDDLIFIHVLDCGGGIIEARAAIASEQVGEFFFCPIYLKIVYGKNEVTHAPFMGGKNQSQRKNKRDLDWLYITLSAFFVIIHDYPDRFKIEAMNDRCFTLVELAALTRIPFDVIKKRSEEEHWPALIS